MHVNINIYVYTRETKDIWIDAHTRSRKGGRTRTYTSVCICACAGACVRARVCANACKVCNTINVLYLKTCGAFITVLAIEVNGK
jgi:hypothetical protein